MVNLHNSNCNPLRRLQMFNEIVDKISILPTTRPRYESKYLTAAYPLKLPPSLSLTEKKKIFL